MDNHGFLNRIQAEPLAMIASFYAGRLATCQKAIAFTQDELD